MFNFMHQIVISVGSLHVQHKRLIIKLERLLVSLGITDRRCNNIYYYSEVLPKQTSVSSSLNTTVIRNLLFLPFSAFGRKKSSGQLELSSPPSSPSSRPVQSLPTSRSLTPQLRPPDSQISPTSIIRSSCDSFRSRTVPPCDPIRAPIRFIEGSDKNECKRSRRSGTIDSVGVTYFPFVEIPISSVVKLIMKFDDRSIYLVKSNRIWKKSGSTGQLFDRLRWDDDIDIHPNARRCFSHQINQGDHRPMNVGRHIEELHIFTLRNNNLYLMTGRTTDVLEQWSSLLSRWELIDKFNDSFFSILPGACQRRLFDSSNIQELEYWETEIFSHWNSNWNFLNVPCSRFRERSFPPDVRVENNESQSSERSQSSEWVRPIKPDEIIRPIKSSKSIEVKKLSGQHQSIQQVGPPSKRIRPKQIISKRLIPSLHTNPMTVPDFPIREESNKFGDYFRSRESLLVLSFVNSQISWRSVHPVSLFVSPSSKDEEKMVISQGSIPSRPELVKRSSAPWWLNPELASHPKKVDNRNPEHVGLTRYGETLYTTEHSRMKKMTNRVEISAELVRAWVSGVPIEVRSVLWRQYAIGNALGLSEVEQRLGVDIANALDECEKRRDNGEKKKEDETEQSDDLLDQRNSVFIWIDSGDDEIVKRAWRQWCNRIETVGEMRRLLSSLSSEHQRIRYSVFGII